MDSQTELKEAGSQYAAAYAVHYKSKDISAALQLYKKLITAHPASNEANYARMQVHNIVGALVPVQELIDAEIEIALSHCEHDH